MSSTGPNPFGSDPSGGAPGQNDPAEALSAAMRDFWGFGAAMIQSAAGSARGGEGDADAFGTMAAPVAGMLDAYADLLRRLAGVSAPGGAGAAELSPALAEAASVAMSSALRYGQGMTEVFARHQGNLVRAAAARMADEADRPAGHALAEAEELRAFLRDVGDTAMLEARRLEHELARVGEAAAQAAAPPSPDDPDRRRWAVKR